MLGKLLIKKITLRIFLCVTKSNAFQGIIYCTNCFSTSMSNVPGISINRNLAFIIRQVQRIHVD
jgi:hypothetical protein